MPPCQSQTAFTSDRIGMTENLQLLDAA
eukprot:COSAG06_NODE_27695_length_588_cov_0.824131_2_plen_27_part_01